MALALGRKVYALQEGTRNAIYKRETGRAMQRVQVITSETQVRGRVRPLRGVCKGTIIMSKNKAIIAIIIVFGLVVFGQLLLMDNSFPVTTGDFNRHANAKVDGEEMLYLGEWLLALVVANATKVLDTSLSSFYLWANYIILFGIGTVLCLVISNTVNKKAGLLTIPIAMFCTQSLLKLFAWGTIFSIANMFLVLPLTLLFLAKWLTQKKVIYALLSLVSLIVFSLFHPSSLYLPFALGIFLAGFALYKTIKKQQKEAIVTYSTGGAVLSLHFALVFSSPILFGGLTDGVTSRLLATIQNGLQMTLSPIEFLYIYLSPATLGIACVAIAGLLQYRREIIVKEETKLSLLMFISFMPALAIGTFTNLAFEMSRHAADLSTVVAIVTACLAGIVLTSHKSKLLTIVIIGIVSIGTVPTLATWFGVQGI